MCNLFLFGPLLIGAGPFTLLLFHDLEQGPPLHNSPKKKKKSKNVIKILGCQI